MRERGRRLEAWGYEGETVHRWSTAVGRTIQTCPSRMDPVVQLPGVQVQLGALGSVDEGEPTLISAGGGAQAPVPRVMPLRGTESMQRNGSAMFMSTPELRGARPVSFDLNFVPPKSHDPTPLVRRISEDLHRRQNNDE